LVFLAPSAPIAGQNLAALGGSAAGLGAGVWWTLSVTSARARAEHVLYGPQDALSYAIPIVATSFATGLTIGLVEEERLSETVLGGAVGWGVGFAVGWIVGDALWEDPAGSWAGGVIGAGVGLLAGAVTGFLVAEPDGGLPAAESRRPLWLTYAVPVRW
jgi:hypothetical protein